VSYLRDFDENIGADGIEADTGAGDGLEEILGAR
jgi:hypothetical protein